MGLTDKQLRDFAEYLMPEKKESPTMQINATVHSIDSTGEKPIYYVNFDGAEGTEPCPVNSTIAEGETTLAEGDRVIVLVQDRQGAIIGNISQPMASSTYDDTELRELISDAKKYATNYMKFTPGAYNPLTNPNAGLVLSENVEASKLGRNLQLMSGGIAIRNNTTDLALFDEDDIYLGLNSSESVIHFCGNRATLAYNADLSIPSFELSSTGSPVSIASYAGGTYGDYHSTVICDNQHLTLETAAAFPDKRSTYSNIMLNPDDGIDIMSDYSVYVSAGSNIDMQSDRMYLSVNELYYGDHTSPIGTVIAVAGGTDYTSNLSSGKETWKTIATITIPAGTWIVNYRVRYQNDTSGNHAIRTYFGTSSDSTAFTDSQFGAASTYLYSNKAVIVKIDSETTYYLRGYATVDGTWFRTASSHLRLVALRIL